MSVFLWLIVIVLLHATALGKVHHHNTVPKVKDQGVPIVTQPHIWASVEGLDFQEAELKIKSDRPELQVEKRNQIYEGMAHEYKEDRVMVFVNDAGKVVGSPIVG